MSRNTTFIFNISSTIILQGIAFFTGPIFSNLLGTNNFGIASVYLTWVQIASTVFSLQAASVIGVAKVNYPKEVQKQYQSSVLSLSTLSYLGFSVVTLIFSIIFNPYLNINVFMVILGLLHGWGLYCVSSANLVLTHELKAGKNLILSVTVTILTVGISVLLIYLFSAENNYWGRILGQSIVYTVIGIAILSYFLIKGKTFYSKEYWNFTLPVAIPTIFHLLAHIVLNQSDKVMIQHIINDSAAGIYALAYTFSVALNAIYSALNNSWVPYYYNYTKEKKTDAIRYHAKNYRELFTVLTIGFILLSREVYHFYAHYDFWSGTDFLPVFALGTYFVFLYSFPVNYEFYHKTTKTIAFGTAFAALCNIILNYVFISVFGIIGAVIATTIAHFLQFVFHYICAKRIRGELFPFKLVDFVPGIILVVIAVFMFFVLKNLWVIRWGIGLIIGIYMLVKIIKRKEFF